MNNITFIKESLPYLLQGALVTLEIALLSSTIGFVLGTILGFLQSSQEKLLQYSVASYATLLRGTPMLIQIFFMAYVLPELGINISLFATAVIAIGLNSSAYISQIIRSGIASVSKGQREAAQVLGLTNFQTMRFIIFPQALRIVLPALVNEAITLIKDSSLASTIGVVELFKQGTIIISRTYNAIPIYCAIAGIYLVLTTSLSGIAHYLEKRMNHYVNH